VTTCIPVDVPLAALRAVIAAPLAWSAPTTIAAALGLDDDAALDVLCELNTAGWLDVWEDAPGGPFVTLSPFAAELLCVRIAEYGAAETPRWLACGEADPPGPRTRGLGLSLDVASEVVDVRLDDRPGAPTAIGKPNGSRRS
jgi:hypothetical protein